MKGFVLAIVLAVGFGVTEHAGACSGTGAGAPVDPRALVADADAAFIGTLVARTAIEPLVNHNGQLYTFTYAVEQKFKGDLRDRIVVTSVLDGGLCGLRGEIGRRAAFLVHRGTSGTRLEEVTEEILRQGTRPYPEPTSEGKAAFVAGGYFGRMRVALLNARAEAIAYGSGQGAVTALSVCPGGAVLTELARSHSGVVFLTARRLPSLTVIRELPIAESAYGSSLVCRSRSGADVLAAITVAGSTTPHMRLFRVSPVGSLILERSPRLAFAVRGAQAFVSVADGRLVARDLDRGTRRILVRTREQLTSLSVQPEGHLLAGIGETSIAIVDLRRRLTIRRARSAGLGGVSWSGPRSLLVWLPGRDGALISFDDQLRATLSPLAWSSHTTTLTHQGAIGVDWSGNLIASRNGSIVRLGPLFSPAVTVLAPL